MNVKFYGDGIPRQTLADHAAKIGLEVVAADVVTPYYYIRGNRFSSCHVGSWRWRDGALREISVGEFLAMKKLI